jgi:hypothetical protein
MPQSTTDRDCCRLCQATDDLEEHHLIPRRKGGSDRDENLVTLCRPCHRTIEEIYDEGVWQRLNCQRESVVSHDWHASLQVILEGDLQSFIETRVESQNRRLEEYQDLPTLEAAHHCEVDGKDAAYELGRLHAYATLRDELESGTFSEPLAERLEDEV